LSEKENRSRLIMSDTLWEVIQNGKTTENTDVKKLTHELKIMFMCLLKKIENYMKKNNPFVKYAELHPDDPAVKYTHWDGFHCDHDDIMGLCEKIIEDGKESYEKYIKNISLIENFYKREVSCHNTQGMFVSHDSKHVLRDLSLQQIDNNCDSDDNSCDSDDNTIYDDINDHVFAYIDEFVNKLENDA
jgi:hypothetical protein